MEEVIIGRARLYLGDCLDVLQAYDIRADHTITDPPYEASVHKTGRRVMGKQGVEVQAINFSSMTEELRSEITKKIIQITDGWVLFFCQIEGVYYWKKAIEDKNGKYFGSMVWVKSDAKPNFLGNGPGHGEEIIVTGWCRDTKTVWNGGGRAGIFIYPSKEEKDDFNEHLTVKPQKLMTELVGLFTNDDQTILDTFMGSGSTGVAAVTMGRNFIGIERDPKYFETSCKRIEQAQQSVFDKPFIKTKMKYTGDILKEISPKKTVPPKQRPVVVSVAGSADGGVAELAASGSTSLVGGGAVQISAPAVQGIPPSASLEKAIDDAVKTGVGIVKHVPIDDIFNDPAPVLPPALKIVKLVKDGWDETQKKTFTPVTITVTDDPFDTPPPDFDLRTGVYRELDGAVPVLGVPKAAYVDPFKALHWPACVGGRQLEFDNDTWDFDTKSTNAVGIDVECYKNFFLVCAKDFVTGKKITFEISERAEFDYDNLRKLMVSRRIITYNGATYDIPMIYMALKGMYTDRLKAASDRIIKEGMKHWDVNREFNIQIPKLDHIDLMEATPAIRSGLKTLAGRMHCKYIVDLPYLEDAELDGEEMNFTTFYCFNDLDDTHMLFDFLKEPLELRRQLSNVYGTDVRSRSDAQIGEMIVKKRAEKMKGVKITKHQDIAALTNKYFKYDVPDWVSFEYGSLQVMLEAVRNAKFYIKNDGKVDTPEELLDLKLRVGDSTYTMGIGGLHSNEANRAVLSDDKNVLIDMDVASQYPSIIMKLGLYPSGIGKVFLEIYGDIIKERLVAKAAGDKVRADGGKIATNGVYGKLGNIYSPLFAPNLMVAVTITGQLSLLMLIEKLELAGIPVVSGNTDGALGLCPRDKEPELQKIVKAWEAATGFQVEQARYKAIYNSSVNSYMAIKEDGKVKRKGPIADPWTDKDIRSQLGKNPQMTICSHAVMKYALDKTKIEDTIKNCTDPRMFVTVTKVQGGAQWRGGTVGKTIRYYWSTDNDQITYINGGKKVPKTDGAKPLMELPDALPADVDYGRYIDEAKRIANDICVDTFMIGG